MSDDAATRLLLVRHGESIVTVDRVIGGEQTCTGLSELGRSQARALARRLEREDPLGVHTVWASSLPRAIETAELIAPALGDDLAIEIDADLVERRPGEADGVPFDQFADRFELVEWRDHPYKPMAPGGESLAAFHFRTNQAIWRLVERYEGLATVVVCHGGVIDVAFRSLLELPMTARFNLWTLNTSITEFERPVGSGSWALVRYNDAAHLDRAGYPLD